MLTWWGHKAHGEVSDEVVNRVYQRVLDGMGLVPLHSSHFSKIFKKLMGTSCGLYVREIGEKERVWVVNPGHPIAKGLGEYFEIPHAEMYGEPFDVPEPDSLVFVSWFAGGEVFRSGCCYKRGRGKVFYFKPGHETYPIFYQEEVLRVIENGILWAAPDDGIDDRPDRTTAKGIPPLRAAGEHQLEPGAYGLDNLSQSDRRDRMDRKLRMGMVGGGRDSFIGPVHRMAAHLDNRIELVCGAFSSTAEKFEAERQRPAPQSGPGVRRLR